LVLICEFHFVPRLKIKSGSVRQVFLNQVSSWLNQNSVALLEQATDFFVASLSHKNFSGTFPNLQIGWSAVLVCCALAGAEIKESVV